MNFLSNPKALSTSIKIFQSKVTKTLQMSNIRVNFPPNVLYFNMLITLEATHMQSPMCLPTMKPHCCWDIIFGATIANLLAKTLVITLNWKFTKAIGQNLSTKFALGNFGTKSTKFKVRLGRLLGCCW